MRSGDAAMTQISEKPLENAKPASRVPNQGSPALRVIREAQAKSLAKEHPPWLPSSERAPVITAAAAMALGILFEEASNLTGYRPLLLAAGLCAFGCVLACFWYFVRLWRLYHW
jgi:hypothetical protein